MSTTNVSTLQAEVSGNMITSVLQVAPNYETKLRPLLVKYKLLNPEPGQWYPLGVFMEFLKEINREYGPSLLFKIGKQISKNHPMLHDYNTLQMILLNLDRLYHYNHRGSDLEVFHLHSFSKERKEAVVKCTNPYPCYLNRGILSMLAHHFKPKEANLIQVVLDFNRPNRLAGWNESYYNVIWV